MEYHFTLEDIGINNGALAMMIIDEKESSNEEL